MKKLFFNLFVGISAIFGLIGLIGTLLFALEVVAFGANTFTIVFFLIEIFLISIFCFAVYKYRKFRIMQIEKAKQEEVLRNREKQLLALYESFGIEPQRKPDGTLKNFYELLGIEPQFDEFGERIPTVYEILKIAPKFDANGNEVPSVVFIKNRISNVAKRVPDQLWHLNKKLSEDAKLALQAAQQAANMKKIAVLAGKKKESKSSSPKLKGMPQRKQKFSPMNTEGSSAKPMKNIDSLAGIFTIGLILGGGSAKPESKPVNDGKTVSARPAVVPETVTPPKVAVVPPMAPVVEDKKPVKVEKKPVVEVPVSVVVLVEDNLALRNETVDNSEAGQVIVSVEDNFGQIKKGVGGAFEERQVIVSVENGIEVIDFENRMTTVKVIENNIEDQHS